MDRHQPGVVLRFQAKKDKGDELFQLVTDLHHTGDPDGPVDWVLSRDASNSDVMWAFEFYRDQDSFDRHYSNPVLDGLHQRVFDLLADEEGLDSSMRVDVHIVSAN
ncbi:putative quinol monooxygenase [Nonomuraea lactucae]|uniref:putative quinol monooxygenase n=1 Tax=Nonomuraea lactucae TaxID=2249762 RepID=UPI000DE4E542|nr:antibiotic biosynthesis monooxygenase [Nonomuraea lactucae]